MAIDLWRHFLDRGLLGMVFTRRDGVRVWQRYMVNFYSIDQRKERLKTTMGDSKARLALVAMTEIQTPGGFGDKLQKL